MLSIAELSAMKLDGEIVPLANSACHFDRVVGCDERVRSLRMPFKPAHIIVGRSAAWVHGAAPLPAIIDLACLRHRRADALPGTRVSIRHVSLLDCEEYGGVQVTGRLRTAADLLADDPFDHEARTAVRMLVDDWHALSTLVLSSRRYGVERMRSRLAACRDDAGDYAVTR